MAGDLEVVGDGGGDEDPLRLVGVTSGLDHEAGTGGVDLLDGLGEVKFNAVVLEPVLEGCDEAGKRTAHITEALAEPRGRP